MFSPAALLSVPPLKHWKTTAPHATHLASMAGLPVLQVVRTHPPNNSLRHPLPVMLGNRGALKTPGPVQLKCK